MKVIDQGWFVLGGLYNMYKILDLSLSFAIAYKKKYSESYLNKFKRKLMIIIMLSLSSHYN